MATTDDVQLQKQVPGEPPPQTGNDPQPATQDEQLQTPIPDEPPPQPNNDSDSDSNNQRIIIIIIACIIIGAGITILVLWLNPPSITVYVESASLTSFNFSSPNILLHNLSVELSIRNPSRLSSAYHRRVQASAYYGGKWFQWAPLDDFHLGRRSTIVQRAVMVGATPVDFGPSEVELYSKQRKAGAFDLEVRLQIRERYRFWGSKSRPRWLYYKCWLPGLRLGGTAGFPRTKCK